METHDVVVAFDALWPLRTTLEREDAQHAESERHAAEAALDKLRIIAPMIRFRAIRSLQPTAPNEPDGCGADKLGGTRVYDDTLPPIILGKFSFHHDY